MGQNPAPLVAPFLAPGGGVTVGPTGGISTDISAGAGGSAVQYLQRVEAICLAGAGATPGAWTLSGAQAGNIILQQPQPTPTPGVRYVWDAPTPLRTAGSSSKFSVTPDKNVGTWFFITWGFSSGEEV